MNLNVIKENVLIGLEFFDDFPCLVECHTEEEICIICKADGSKPIAELIDPSMPKRQAFVHMHVGYYVIYAYPPGPCYDTLYIKVYRITKITHGYGYMNSDLIACFENGEWVASPPQELNQAVEVAINVALGIIEQKPYYVLPRQ